eukprot:365157-Chlamydomonas_euryale.AAC.11
MASRHHRADIMPFLICMPMSLGVSRGYAGIAGSGGCGSCLLGRASRKRTSRRPIRTYMQFRSLASLACSGTPSMPCAQSRGIDRDAGLPEPPCLLFPGEQPPLPPHSPSPLVVRPGQRDAAHRSRRSPRTWWGRRTPA